MGNANSGRRPKPHALKVLQGITRQDRLNPDQPQPPSGDVVKPPMSRVAGAVWDRLAPIAIAMGTLTPADVEVFRTLCRLQATLDLADAQKDAPEFAPFTVSEDYNGADKVGLHAAIKLEKEFATTIRPYYALFGLEPVGRSRIRVPKADEPQSKWAGKLA